MISNLLFIIGLVFIFIGLLGMYRFRTFHSRLMASTLIDTAGYLCILLAILLRWGIRTETIKIIFLFFTMLVINPITTHFLIQSAWKSGHKEDVKEEESNEYNTDNDT